MNGASPNGSEPERPRYWPVTAWPKRSGHAGGQWIIRDVLRPGGLMAIAGPRGVQKSQVGIDLALSIAGGDPWLDYHQVGTTGRTFYIFNEGDDEDYEERLWSIAASKYGDDAKDVLANVLVSSDPFFLTDERDLKWLEAVVKDQEPVLVFIDVLRSALRPNKKYTHPLMSDDCAAEVLGELRRIGQINGCGFAYANHHNKNRDSQDDRDRMIGATAWFDKPEASLTLRFNDDQDHTVISHQMRTAPLPKLMVPKPKEKFSRDKPYRFRAVAVTDVAKAPAPPPTIDVVRAAALSILSSSSDEMKLSVLTGRLQIPNSRKVLVEALTQLIEEDVIVERTEEIATLVNRKSGGSHIKKDLEHWYHMKSADVLELPGMKGFSQGVQGGSANPSGTPPNPSGTPQ